MAQITLGLDIGYDAIRGVRVAQTLRGTRLVDFFERKVPREETGALPAFSPLGSAQAEVLKQLLSEGIVKAGERVAVSLPGTLVSMREMTLPSADPKRLRRLVPFEVESQLPFDLEEALVDYQPLPPSLGAGAAPSESRVLAAVLSKEILRRFLGQLQELGVDPAWVGVDSICLYTFYQYFSKEFSSPGGGTLDLKDELLLIDVGASKTVLCDVQGGALKSVRTFPLGGAAFTRALQQEFQLSREEAEKLVKEINLSDPAPSQKRAADCVKEALAPWLTEIEKSLRSAGAAPSFFYLCGGAGGMEGLQEAVAQTLQAAPAVLEGGLFDKTFPVAGPEGIDRERFSRLFVEAAGLALAPDGASDGERINFRREEFVFGKETLEKRNRLVSLGLIVLLLLGLMGADLYLHYHGKETHFQNLKRQLRSSFTETFPQTKNVVNEIEQIRTMIGELDRRGAFLGAGGISPLEVLREVTTAVPPEVRIDVQELVVDGEKIRIEAQTDSYESVDRIRGGLLKSSRFQEVNVGDAKVSADQSKVGFRIQMSVAERGKR